MESDDTESDGETNICPIPMCNRNFSTVAGLRQHWSKGHSSEEIQAAITRNTSALSQQPSPLDSTSVLQIPVPPAPPPASASVSNPPIQPHGTELEQMKNLLVTIQTLKAHTTVLKRIPKAARIQTAIEFYQLIIACIRPNASFMAWAHLFTFSYIAFKSPDRKNKLTKNLSIATIVKRNLDVWSKLKRLPFNEFSKNVLSNLQRRKKSKTAKDAEALRIKLVQSKLSDGDISGTIRVLSSNDSIADFNTDTYQKMLDKHPAANVTIDVETETALEIQPVGVGNRNQKISLWLRNGKFRWYGWN